MPYVQITPAIPACVTALAGEQGILMRVVQNPTQPGFNHYLFESVAALVKQGCAESPGMVGTLENMLLPPFNYVLSQDVQVPPIWSMNPCLVSYMISLCSSCTRFESDA